MEIQNKNTIAIRSHYIIEARSKLTASQNRVIDILMSNLQDDNELSYELDISQYKGLIYSDTSNIYRDFRMAVKKFEKNDEIYIYEDSNKENYTFFHWFSKIKYNNGKIFVNIDKDLKPILVDTKRYVRYNIEYTLNFKSSYSQKIYLMLKLYEDTGVRMDSIDLLAYKLCLPNTYKNYSNLKKFVLDVAKEEINSISDIIIDYNILGKKGKKVTSLQFNIIKKKRDNIYMGEQKLITKEYLSNALSSLLTPKDINKLYNCLSAIEKLDDTLYFQNNFKLAINYHSKNKNVPLIALAINSLKENWYDNNRTKQSSFDDNGMFTRGEDYWRDLQKKLEE